MRGWGEEEGESTERDREVCTCWRLFYESPGTLGPPCCVTVGPTGCVLRVLGLTLPAAPGPAFWGPERRVDTEFTPTTPNGWGLAVGG